MSFNENNEIAIEVTGISKCYQIFEKPSDRLKQMLSRGRKQYFKEFWALKDINFTIKRGETVGIIGRNGSGKSTLLQVICGTLNPTHGEVKVNGRVAALLELGAGFNPEFSGVENVYMAASLYGLSRSDIDKRFQEIEAFADIGEHIHQPVKTYSSGMYVRLAFAVIANVDADILVIDEALAVGDAVFTQKCMRFLREFTEKKTLVFVSHDNNSVMGLCNKAIWLKDGRLVEIGIAKQICENYLNFIFGVIRSENNKNLHCDKDEYTNIRKIWGSKNNYENHSENGLFKNNLDNSLQMGPLGAKIEFVEIVDEYGREIKTLSGGEIVTLSIHAIAYEYLNKPIIGFFVKDKLGQFLFGSNTLKIKKSLPPSIEAGNKLTAKFTFPMPWLSQGDYSIQVAIADGDQNNHKQHHWIHDALIFHSMNDPSTTGLIGIPVLEIDLSETK